MSAATTWTNATGKPGSHWKINLVQKLAVKDLEVFASVNEQGIAIFENVPIGVHWIVVPEFWDYHQAEGEAWMIKTN